VILVLDIARIAQKLHDSLEVVQGSHLLEYLRRERRVFKVTEELGCLLHAFVVARLKTLTRLVLSDLLGLVIARVLLHLVHVWVRSLLVMVTDMMVLIGAHHI